MALCLALTENETGFYVFVQFSGTSSKLPVLKNTFVLWNNCRYMKKVGTYHWEFLNMVHPVSPKVNTLSKHGALVKTKKVILVQYY